MSGEPIRYWGYLMHRKRNRWRSSCDRCGRFIALEDFNATGGPRATCDLVTPDSHYSSETYQTICKRCNSK